MKKTFGILFLILIFAFGMAWAEEDFPPPRDHAGVIGNARNHDAWGLGMFDVLELSEVDAQSTPPATTGYLYVKRTGGTSALYFHDTSGTVVQLAAGATTAWDDIGNPDANDTITFGTYTMKMTGANTATDNFTFDNTAAFGDVSVFKVEQKTGNPTDGTLVELILADTDPDFLSLKTAGVEKWLVDSSGNLTIASGSIVLNAGDLTVGGTLYESAIAPLIGNLTVNAQGAGTISVGNSSTGVINITGGGVNIGDGATDTLTITGIIDGDVTMDDGTTDSPKLIFKDSDDEQHEIYADQDTDDLNVECANADDSLAVTVGNISVGTPNANDISIDGGDLFVEDDMEVDGAAVFDGTAKFDSTVDINGAATLDSDVTMSSGLQVSAGRVWIGNGSTPDVTPGDDDLFVEGTIEVDGAARFDGAITATSSLNVASGLTVTSGASITGGLTVAGGLSGATTSRSFPVALLSAYCTDAAKMLGADQTETTPGVATRDNMPAVIWADNETSKAQWTFRLPSDYSTALSFRLLSSASSITTPSTVGWQIWVNKDGQAFATTAVSQTAVAMVGGDTSNEEVTLTVDATGLAAISSGNWISIDLWNTTTGNGSLEIKGIQGLYTAVQ